jgi:excisionase family DNA binding protein
VSIKIPTTAVASLPSKILLRVADAAHRLSISVWKLRQLAYEREIVSVKVGSLLLFRPEDLEHFAERNRNDGVRS